MRYRLWHLLLFIALVNVVGAPQLLRYRAQARSEACQNQLRKIGMAMMNYINLDPAGQFCSGAPDFRRFGSLDAVGWTADYSIYGQDAGVAPKAPMCPGSNVAGLTSIYDMVQLECAQVNGNWRTHPSGGVAEAERFVDVQAGPSNTFAGTAAGTPERIALISRATAKYNTNYTASWFLVDTAPTLYTVDNYPFQAFAGDEAGPRTGLSTEGPLHIRDIEIPPSFPGQFR